MARATVTFVVLLSLAGALASCELADSGMNDTGPDLDMALTDLLTSYGQRPITTFRLPESDDLSSIPQDPRNPLTPSKVELGRLLFHETAIATNPVRPEGRGTYACTTCHHSGAGFQAGRHQAIAEGGEGWGENGEARRTNTAYGPGQVDALPIKSPAVLNTAFQKLMMWDGRLGSTSRNAGTEARWIPGSEPGHNRLGYEGLETQAIAALTGHRFGDVRFSFAAQDATYRTLWAEAFPDELVSNEIAGLAIAAYERTIFANRAPFQRWLRGESNAMTDAEKRGAILFFGKAGCEDVCHSGPALNILEFYALGMADMAGPDVIGNVPENKGRGGFTGLEDEEFLFKVPQLYNLKDSPFLGHGGTFRSIREVVDYYNAGVPDKQLPEGRLSERFVPLELSEREVDDLVAFLSDALYDPDLERYAPASLPSGNCTPANDPLARRDLGCD